MPHWLNKSLKTFLSLNKSEQRGIIVLVIIILVIAVAYLLMPYFVSSKSTLDPNKYKAEIETFLAEQKLHDDSVNTIMLQNLGKLDLASATKKINPFLFDPNNLPVESWKKMGFTDNQIKTIKNYEAKGGTFKDKEDLKKIYSISDVEYEIIEPYISIASGTKSQPKRVDDKKANRSEVIYKSVEINSADSSKLIESLRLSPWLAKRIILYRNILGGYIDKKQLNEVYGLTGNIYNLIEGYIDVDTSLVTRIDINNVEFKKLLNHPYFDYSVTKSIFDTRNKIGAFSSVNQLRLIDDIHDSTFNKVRYYLYIRPSKK